MKPALLDVNVLLALVWPNHQHHAEAHAWFAQEASHGWGTNPVVQLAFVRLSSNPAYTADAVSPQAAAEMLASLTAHPKHRACEGPEASDPAIYASAFGHQQVNDAYLVASARAAGARLVTFDRRLSVHDPAGKVVRIIGVHHPG